MKEVKLVIDGIAISFNTTRAFAEIAVNQLTEEFVLIAWYDGQGIPAEP